MPLIKRKKSTLYTATNDAWVKIILFTLVKRIPMNEEIRERLSQKHRHSSKFGIADARYRTNNKQASDAEREIPKSIKNETGLLFTRESLLFE